MDLVYNTKMKKITLKKLKHQIQTTSHAELSLIKQREVQNYFDLIARRYDLANTIMSFGLHHFWRRMAVSKINLIPPNKKILDLCCGTGMITCDLAKKIGLNGKVVGFDQSQAMLAIARRRLLQKGFLNKVDLVKGDAARLPFEDNSFDAAIVGYGLRNVGHPETVLREMYRVLKPAGKIVVLEIAKPDLPILRKLYFFYLNTWIPLVGAVLGRNKAVYQYLCDSIIDFPLPKQFIKTLDQVGLIATEYFLLTWGVVAIYTGLKPSIP